jgi:hypothetical protein
MSPAAPASTRIYAGGALAFGGQPAIDDLKAAEYSTVIIWSVHVDSNGDLKLNDTPFVSGGVYKETEPMGLPGTVAQLRGTGVEIVFSVGAGGVEDFTHIAALLNDGVPGPGNALYDNFNALKRAMLAAGGDIDGIDFDNEDNLSSSVMVNFGRMLHNIGYAHVTLCPYYSSQEWTDTLEHLNQAPGVGFVNAIHLQCYSGGGGNVPSDIVQSWQDTIANAGSAGKCVLIPGLATTQASPGPWWYDSAPGKSVVETPSVAMYEQADWSKHLLTENYPDANAALQGAQSRGGATFFFYCNGPLDLGPGKQFRQGDAVFFAGQPWWGSAPQCVAFSLSGGCENIYNPPPLGACPSDLEGQYKIWSTIKTPPQGGFIWLYDSVVSCLLSHCCGGTDRDPATTARDYRNAIANGLTSSS